MPALDWVNKKLRAQGTSPNEVVAKELQAQGAANATVRNIITSMRWMSSIDWEEFFENVSLVDEVLCASPGFAAMDFATRNEYRTQIELLSRGSGRSEIEVAQEALLLARNAVRERLDKVEAGFPQSKWKLPGVPERAEEDPGYYLISRGRRAFERRLGVRVPLHIRLYRAYRVYREVSFIGGDCRPHRPPARRRHVPHLDHWRRPLDPRSPGNPRPCTRLGNRGGPGLSPGCGSRSTHCASQAKPRPGRA